MSTTFIFPSLCVVPVAEGRGKRILKLALQNTNPDEGSVPPDKSLEGNKKVIKWLQSAGQQPLGETETKTFSDIFERDHSEDAVTGETVDVVKSAAPGFVSDSDRHKATELNVADSLQNTSAQSTGVPLFLNPTTGLFEQPCHIVYFSSESEFCADEDVLGQAGRTSRLNPKTGEFEYLSDSSDSMISDSTDISTVFDAVPNVSQHRRSHCSPKNVSSLPDVVVNARSKINGKRRRKNNHCSFCDEVVMQLPRHLRRQHAELPEVSAELCKHGKELKLGLLRLRNLGNFRHNISVLENGCGILHVSKRSHKKSKAAEDYLPCVHCLAFYCRDQLWRHCRRCPLNKKQSAVGKESNNVGQGHVSCCAEAQVLLDGSLLHSDSTEIDTAFKQGIVDKMRKDSVRDAVIADPAIVSFGEVLYTRLGPQRAIDIQQRLRQLARLMQTINMSNDDTPPHRLASLISGTNFDIVVRGVQSVADLNVHSTGRRIYQKPSLAVKLGHSLKKCAQIKLGMGIRQSDVVMQQEANAFLFLHEAEWQDKVTSACTTTMKLSKMNKVQELPDRQDLDKLKEYQTKQLQLLTDTMKTSPNYDTWRELSELTLSRMTLFNKRRGGEAAQLLLSQYVDRPNWLDKSNREVIAGLLPIEKELMKRMDMVQIPGKRLNNVPLLLTPDVKAAMDVLVQTRSAVGIPVSNGYFFPSYSTNGHLDACQVIQKVVKHAGVKNPEQITTTKLRKYVATMMQMMDLKQTELDWVSRHLGHSLNIHKFYYRQHTSAIEMGKVSKLLLQLEEGQAVDYSGKSLQQITLDGMNCFIVSIYCLYN